MRSNRYTNKCSRCGKYCAGEKCNRCLAIPDGMVSSNEVLGVLGITYRQLDHWSTTLLKLRTGSGKQRNYDPDEFLTLANIWILTELGLKPATAMESTGSTVIEGLDCLVTVDLGQLRADIDYAFETRKTLREIISERIGEGAA